MGGEGLIELNDRRQHMPCLFQDFAEGRGKMPEGWGARKYISL